MTKKVAIYDPYLNTLGGGERYCLTVAETMLSQGWQVDLFWSRDQAIINQAEKRFHLNLQGLSLVPDVFHIAPVQLDLISESPESIANQTNLPAQAQNILHRLKRFFRKISVTRQYDIIFYLSDGSIPFLFSKKNYLHVQVPFPAANETFLQRLTKPAKLLLIKKVICNSEFTQRFAIKTIGDKTKVVYPPVDIENFAPSSSKDNVIITVGRFDNLLNAKKQDVLIECFKNLYPKYGQGWKMVLAGGSTKAPEDNLFLSLLQRQSKGYPIEFFVNPDFSLLQRLYSRSKIYWHAAGYGVDENLAPQNTEHFGMTVVEAMSSGCVPLVVAKGGLPEIVNDSQNGFLWNNPQDLIDKTKKLAQDEQLLQTLSANAQNSVGQFSKKSFSQTIIDLFEQP